MNCYLLNQAQYTKSANTQITDCFFYNSDSVRKIFLFAQKSTSGFPPIIKAGNFY